MTRLHRATGGDYADPAEVETWAQQLPDEFLYCRRYGHKWGPWDAKIIDGTRTYEEITRCSRCYARRPTLIDAFGRIVTTRILYPENYLHKGLGRVVGEGRDVLRLEAVTRIIDHKAQKNAERQLRKVG